MKRDSHFPSHDFSLLVFSLELTVVRVYSHGLKIDLKET